MEGRVGPYVGVNTVLVGFFAFAALYHLVLWLQARREPVLLAFVTLCALCAIFSGCMVALATARTPAEGQRALDLRAGLAMLTQVPEVWLLSLLSGVRARAFIGFVTVASMALVVSNGVQPLAGTVIGIERIVTTWGEPLSVLQRESASRWLGAAYALSIAVNLFGLLCAARLWRSDGVGGALLATASGGLLAGVLWGARIDAAGFRGVYVGAIPHAASVILVAVQIARGHQRRGERLAAAEAERTQLLHDLGERVKELTALHKTANVLQENRPFDQRVLAELVAILPAAWQYPEVCEARIHCAGLEAKTDGWHESQWLQTESFVTSDGRTGSIEVCYREARPAEAEGAFLREERRLLQSLARMLATHLDRQRAEQAMRTLSGRLVTAQEEERRHIARELHDEIGQVLTVVRMNLLSLREPAQPQSALAKVESCTQNVDRAIEQVRALALDLRPPILDHVGLPAALRWFVDRIPDGSPKTHLAVEDAEASTLSPEVKTAAFRIAQEAVTNVLRHASASNVWVTLAARANDLELSVRDDGSGFDLRTSRGSPEDSFGLSSMEERVRLVGGRLEIRTAPGAGTEVCARFPMATA